jgi:serine/threonine protein kinase
MQEEAALMNMAAARGCPGLVGLVDYGIESTDDGQIPYIVMEYVAGRTIRQLMAERGVFNVSGAARVITDICRGLQALHEVRNQQEENAIHGDIKPENVMLTDEAAVKLLDLGVGGLVFAGKFSGSATQGTSNYMAPELWLFEKPHVGSDIYSLGIMFFEMLTNRKPFPVLEWRQAGQDNYAIEQALRGTPLPELWRYSGFQRLRLAAARQMDEISFMVSGTSRTWFSRALDRFANMVLLEQRLKAQRVIARMTHVDAHRRYQDYSSLLAALKNIA